MPLGGVSQLCEPSSQACWVGAVVGGGVGPEDDGEVVGVEVGLEEVGGDVGAGVGSDVVG